MVEFVKDRERPSEFMDLGILISGMCMGFSLAVGVGPVNVLCIRRALARGYGAGLWSGFGAASADAILAFTIGLGLASVTEILESHASWLQVGGAVFLIVWGVRVAFARLEAGEKDDTPGRIVMYWTSTFLLTLLNPANFATFSLAASGFGLLERDLAGFGVVLFIAGIFVGSMLWWTTLAFGAAFFQRRFVGDLLPIVNKIAGSVITLFGIALLLYDP